MGEAAPLAVTPPGEEVTVYEVIGAPPSEAGGANATTACPLPAAAMALVGAPGTVSGVIASLSVARVVGNVGLHRGARREDGRRVHQRTGGSRGDGAGRRVGHAAADRQADRRIVDVAGATRGAGVACAARAGPAAGERRGEGIDDARIEHRVGPRVARGDGVHHAAAGEGRRDAVGHW